MDPRAVAERFGEVQLVDVRYANEWRAGHIEGSVNIPEEDLPERVEELDRDRRIVTVCRAGSRSGDAAEWLRGEGFDAENLDGGMLAWKWAGLPITGAIVGPDVDPEPELDSPDLQALHNQFLEIALAVQERFGVAAEPSEEEVKGFLRERMISEGRTPEDADAVLRKMDEGQLDPGR